MPVFVLALRLPPNVTIGTGLITKVFGFANGVYAYARKRLIDYRPAINNRTQSRRLWGSAPKRGVTVMLKPR